MVLEHVKQLRVVDFQQHAGDLARQLGVHALNKGEQPLPEHLLLFVLRGIRQHGGSQRLLTLHQYGLK